MRLDFFSQEAKTWVLPAVGFSIRKLSRRCFCGWQINLTTCLKAWQGHLPNLKSGRAAMHTQMMHLAVKLAVLADPPGKVNQLLKAQ
jgi:hypothetical protein